MLETGSKCVNTTIHLREKKANIKDRCVVLGDLVKNGKLSETEYNDLVQQKNKLLHEIEIGIEGNVTASQQTFIAGLGVIELLGKSSAFMELDGFELDKARLVKLVLSNSTLENGRLRYDYKKPFDDLIELTRHCPY